MSTRSALALIGFLCTTAGISAAAPALIVLHRFKGVDGSNPIGPLVADAAGNLYGTTQLGGSNGIGAVFRLSSPRGSGSHWKETVLHSFSGGDGADAIGGLVRDPQGNLYGVTFSGAAHGAGGVFELSPAGKRSWNFTQVYSLGADVSDGQNPEAGLFRDTAGNLYGATYYGGAADAGTVFKLSPRSGGTWSESVLHAFRDKPDGAYPSASLIVDAGGTVYGTTGQGGTGHCGDGDGDKSGCGTVFTLRSSQDKTLEAELYDFQKNEENAPSAPLTFGPDGALYGSAGYDVFVLRQQSEGSWQKQTIYEFKEGIAGTYPSSGVVFDAGGNLYGTTRSSGIEGFGTVYELTPPTTGETWSHRTLAKFGKDQPQPAGGVLIGSDGTLYGAASAEPGYIFAIER
jgi:uncharacterized repeat protein (TIGR03803 family)